MALLNVTGSWIGGAYQTTANFNAGAKGEHDVAAADRQALRDLAARVAEEAALPVQREKRELWRRHNDLETFRPLVLCDPENGWNEIILSGDLVCRSALGDGAAEGAVLVARDEGRQGHRTVLRDRRHAR